MNGDDEPNFTKIDDNSYQVSYAANVDSSAILDGFTLTGGNGTDGGGMFITALGYPTLSHLNFAKNKTSGYGGGLYIDSGCPTVSNTIFSGNAAYTGAGLSIWNACLTLSGVSFSGNSASGSGGGIYSRSGNLVLKELIFSGNSSIQDGGGIYLSNGSSQLTNAVISKNTASNGAGIYNTSGSSATLTNVTFSGNSANPGQAGGIYNTSGGTPYASTMAIRNSILWGDSNSEIYNETSGTPSTSNFTYSLAQGCNPGGAWTAACGVNGGNILADGDPLFVDPTQGNLRLRTASAAIDKGNNAIISSGATDLDGNPRILNGTVDLGAYEYQNYAPLVADFARTGPADQDLTFALSDFTSHFTDANGDTPGVVRITALPNHGALYLGASAVVLNQQIPVGSIGGLHFIPPAHWSGIASFGWNGSDGVTYASQPAAVALTILPPKFDVYLPAIKK